MKSILVIDTKVNSKRWFELNDLPNEEWREVDEFYMCYISNYGRVLRGERIVKRSDGKIQTYKARIYKNYLNSNGYYCVGISENGKTYSRYIHRLLGKYFLKVPDYQVEINHINGIKTDNRIENLEWVTSSQNTQHAIKNGLLKIKGEDNYNTNLTDEDVKNIIIIGNIRKYKHQEIAKKFHTTRNVVQKILNGDRWKHIKVINLLELPSKEELEDAFEDLLWNSEVLDKTDLQDYPKYKLLNNLINTIYGSDEE